MHEVTEADMEWRMKEVATHRSLFHLIIARVLHTLLHIIIEKKIKNYQNNNNFDNTRRLIISLIINIRL